MSSPIDRKDVLSLDEVPHSPQAQAKAAQGAQPQKKGELVTGTRIVSVTVVEENNKTYHDVVIEGYVRSTSINGTPKTVKALYTWRVTPEAMGEGLDAQGKHRSAKLVFGAIRALMNGDMKHSTIEQVRERYQDKELFVESVWDHSGGEKTKGYDFKRGPTIAIKLVNSTLNDGKAVYIGSFTKEGRAKLIALKETFFDTHMIPEETKKKGLVPFYYHQHEIAFIGAGGESRANTKDNDRLRPNLKKWERWQEYADDYTRLLEKGKRENTVHQAEASGLSNVGNANAQPNAKGVVDDSDDDDVFYDAEDGSSAEPVSKETPRPNRLRAPAYLDDSSDEEESSVGNNLLKDYRELLQAHNEALDKRLVHFQELAQAPILKQLPLPETLQNMADKDTKETAEYVRTIKNGMEVTMPNRLKTHYKDELDEVAFNAAFQGVWEETKALRQEIERKALQVLTQIAEFRQLCGLPALPN